MGLSPRVRGNRRLQGLTGGCMRSIPARAGEPRCSVWHGDDVQVYPRACGGTVDELSVGYDFQGLSPRVRGNLRKEMMDTLSTGSIPARAGEPVALAVFPHAKWVYPRACGGTCVPDEPDPQMQGLSPRVRGNRIMGVYACTAVGSIPARAGEPSPGGRRRV